DARTSRRTYRTRSRACAVGPMSSPRRTCAKTWSPMALSDRLGQLFGQGHDVTEEVRRPPVRAPEPPPPARDTYQELKSRIHHRLIESLDLSNLARIPSDVLEKEIRGAVEALVQAERTPMSRLEREQLVVEILHESLGLGPLEPLLHD